MASPYLVKRRAGYYVRVRIPADLAPVLGTHLTRSLATKDHVTARRLAIRAVALIGNVWDGVRCKMYGYKPTGDFRTDVEEFNKHLRALEAVEEIEEVLPPEEVKSYTADEVAAIIKAVRADERTATIPVLSVAEKARLEGINEGFEKALAKLGANLSVAPPSQPAPQINPNHQKRWFAEVVPEFFRQKGFGESARVSYERAFREFEDLVGDKPICELTAGDVRAYREWLEAKPGKKPGTKYAHGSLVKDLGHIKGFLAWAVVEDWIAADPAEKVRAPEEKSAAAKRDQGIDDDDRRAFTRQELETIYHSPLFTGCRSRWSHREPGPNIYREDRYYFLLTKLLTGARKEELAGAPAKMYDLEGIPCLDLRHTGTKTKAAPRIVPIQDALRRTGFFTFAAKKAKSGERLFTDVDDWSKWSNRYIDDIGIDDDTVVAYSLRHNFRQALRAANLHIETTNRIFGHKGDGVGPDYGPTLTVPEAENFLATIKPSITLNHLYIL